MKLLHYYTKRDPIKINLRVTFDRESKDRPAWIQIKGLPKGVNFIMVHLGKKGREGRRVQFYKTYLPEGLFLPIDYTKEEMQEFYNKFAEIYDKELRDNKQNLRAGKFLCDKLKRYSSTSASILDLGAGTGLITEIYIDAGFKNITLFDYSKGMLDEAKKRNKLKDCKFILGDIKKLNLKNKYDIIISNFSLGCPSYFTEDELRKSLKLIKKRLKPDGIIAILGYFKQSLFERGFKKLESGVYLLNKKKNFYADYFVGRRE